MPLVTQLSEGVQPIVFPTDLSINALEKQTTSSLSVTTTTTINTTTTTTTPPSITTTTTIKQEHEHTQQHHHHLSSNNNSGTTTPHKIKSLPIDELLAEKASVGKLNLLSEEEATALMLKAAAEKVAAVAAANNSGNLSDTSFSEDNNSGVADYHATASSISLSNINILSNISAMNSLIGSSLGGNTSIASSSSANAANAINNNNSVVGGGGGSSSGGSCGGHPCPDCGRVYKLKSSLRNHQKWECGKEPQFQCPFCVYRAKQKMHIGRHMERMHKEKFKLEDLKSYTNAGGNASGASGAGSDDSALNELRQQFH